MIEYFYRKLNISRNILYINNKQNTTYYCWIVMNHITFMNFSSFARIIKLN